ncbi:hypothetical protein ONZ43_g5874 [Nemania bipapillata]|uniref:Uncharacterized protein n=1 Tax=Nemania bipapillata TaxID=110536 RepID=A0ACC2I667_9PEZI|nr:hypothetical protein ONZ43_g5874 [Nemania bipapillata]
MDKIPPEIVYIICSQLGNDDIRNFRLVNKLFAEVGAAYMLPHVSFYMRQKELDRLEAISLHPIFSKHVISLTYYPETVASPKFTLCEFLRDHQKRMRWNGTLRASPRQLLAQYKQYTDIVDEQGKLIKKQKDTSVLKAVLPRFPKLEAVVMSTGQWRFDPGLCVRRKSPFPEFPGHGYMNDSFPEGKRQLDALLMANAHSPCAFTSLRAGTLHWRFFKRTERELRLMFQPLAGLTSIDLSIGIEPPIRIREANSHRKCQRLLARGVIRNILKNLLQLQSLRIEIENPEEKEDGKGAALRDIIEPGFRWPNLKDVTLCGIESNRAELMSVFMLHRDTLRRLCLRDIDLISTSWRKLLPDIRKNLCLEDACICGQIYGQTEDEDEMQEGWEWDGFTEYWENRNIKEAVNGGIQSTCTVDKAGRSTQMRCPWYDLKACLESALLVYTYASYP